MMSPEAAGMAVPGLLPGTGPGATGAANGAGDGGYGKAPVPQKPAFAGPYTGGSLEGEKKQLLHKLWEVQKNNMENKAKWWSFCKVHADGNTEPKSHDVAFLLTFFEALEADDIAIEEGCPFQPKGAGKGCGGKDAGQGKGWGKDAGKGWGGGKDFGKGGKGFGGGGFGGGGGKGGGPRANPDQEIFVGGIPKGATEEELQAHFSFYGSVQRVLMKYDEMGGFRGFGFVTFDTAEAAQKVLADANNQTFKGKWIDCKSAANSGSKGGGGGKDGGGGKCSKGDKGGKGKDKGDKGNGKSFGKDKGGKGKGGGWGGGGGGGGGWGGGGGGGWGGGGGGGW